MYQTLAIGSLTDHGSSNFTRTTVVVELDRNSIPATSNYQVTTLRQLLERRTTRAQLTDVSMLIVGISPITTIAVNGRFKSYLQMFIIDKTYNERTLRLTVWEGVFERNFDILRNAQVQRRGIIGSGLNVVYCEDECTLQSTEFTQFDLDIDDEEGASQLTDWMHLQFGVDIHTFQQVPSSAITLEELIMLTTDIPSDDDVLEFTINVTIMEFHIDSIFWYNVCSWCGKMQNCVFGDLQACRSCQNPTMKFLPRYRIGATVFDNSGEIKVVICDREAEKVLYQPVEYTQLIYSQWNGKSMLKEHLESCTGYAYIMNINVSKKNFASLRTKGYNVLTIERIVQPIVPPIIIEIDGDEGEEWNTETETDDE